MKFITEILYASFTVIRLKIEILILNILMVPLKTYKFVELVDIEYSASIYFKYGRINFIHELTIHNKQDYTFSYIYIYIKGILN